MRFNPSVDHFFRGISLGPLFKNLPSQPQMLMDVTEDDKAQAKCENVILVLTLPKKHGDRAKQLTVSRPTQIRPIVLGEL